MQQHTLPQTETKFDDWKIYAFIKDIGVCNWRKKQDSEKFEQHASQNLAERTVNKDPSSNMIWGSST